jgi:hypothetical protein
MFCKRKNFQKHAIRVCAICTSIFIRDKPILSSERVLYKDYDRKGPIEKELVISHKMLRAKNN